MKLARTTLMVIIVKSVRMDSGEIHGMEGFAMVGCCTCSDLSGSSGQVPVVLIGGNQIYYALWE